METSLLHDKIKRFTVMVNEGKLNGNFTKEMIRDFNTWATAYEQEFEKLELEIYKAGTEILDKDEFIDMLCQLLIVAGYGSAIATMSVMDKEDFKRAIEFLISCKDRWNGNNIYVIATLLRLAKDEGKEVKNMVDLVKYARTGI